MYRVGITGEMGCGKSYISKLFSNIGVPIYNCDQRAKFLTTNNQDLISEIKKYFGENIYEGNVFKNLASIVFAPDETSVKNLKILTDIIYPYLYKDIDSFCEQNKNKVYCLIETAVLYENNMDIKLDMVIYVDVRYDIRLKRAIERDKISKDDYDNRMKTQISPIIKKTKSTFTINNDGLTDVRQRIIQIDSAVNNHYLVNNYCAAHNDYY